jgi:hypothetical protein
MELITRALAGVVATWIPIEGAEHRKLVPKAKMTGFTSARSRAKDLFAGQGSSWNGARFARRGAKRSTKTPAC